MRMSYIVKVVTLLTVLLISVFPTEVLAEDGPSTVQECMKNPDKCADKEEKDNKEKESQKVAKTSSTTVDFLKAIVAFAVVIALLYFVMKFINSRNSKYQHNQMIQNLGGITLGAQKSVQLLQMGNRLYLVGVGENIQLLKEITDPVEIEALQKMYEDKQILAAAPVKFAEVFSRFKKDKPTQENDTSFNVLFQEKINKINAERQEEINNWKKETDK